MIYSTLRLFTAAALLSLAISCDQKTAPSSIDQQEMPNILLIITDDQGHGDLGFHGNPHIKTPTLDQLASESTRFTQFYVSPVCAPTRSSLMTGRYSLRTGVWDTYNGGAIMATEEKTIAEYLAEQGYRTGMFGKWHLGDNYPFRPIDQGFDTSVRHEGGGIGQVGNIYNYFQFDSSYFNPKLLSNGLYKEYNGYCSDIFTDEALAFIEENPDQPFFTYLSFNAPHTPLQLPEEYLNIYDTITMSTSDYRITGYPIGGIDENAARKVYGMVSNIDDNLARLFSKLKDLGEYDNTIIIFMTDNGPQQRRYNSGFRGLKGSVFEGGTRVPFFIRFPKKFTAGKEVQTPAAHIDVLPTLLELIGENPANNIDGQSLLPLLEGNDSQFSDRAIYTYWQRGFPEKYRNVSMRKGDYKFVGRTDYPWNNKDFELFNISEDAAELFDLSETQPELLEDMKAEFDNWFDEIIQSPHLSPRYIEVGTPNENPVYLNRNDAKGEPGIWAQDNIYGYWDIKSTAGTYDIKFYFREKIKRPGSLTMRFGRTQKTLYNEDTTTNVLEIKNLKLDEVSDGLESWYWSGRSPIMPFYVEVDRVDLP